MIYLILLITSIFILLYSLENPAIWKYTTLIFTINMFVLLLSVAMITCGVARTRGIASQRLVYVRTFGYQTNNNPEFQAEKERFKNEYNRYLLKTQQKKKQSIYFWLSNYAFVSKHVLDFKPLK